MSSIGQNVPRSDGPAKVTGLARFVDDLTRPGMLHGATVRSAVPRGRLLGVDLDPSFDWKGIAVVTAADLPDGDNVVALIEEDQPILAREEIRHAYEPVALLACEDPLRLRRALGHVSLRVEPLPAVLTMEDALARTSVVYGSDNVMKRYRIVKGDPEGALAGDGVLVSGTYAVHHQEHIYIEPQGVIAWWDESGAHVLGSLQCPYYVLKGIKRAFHVEEDRIDVTQAVTGGGFGGKEEYPTLIGLHALLLARKSGRPVKMIYDRKEDIEATTKRHPAEVSIRSLCDPDGTLRAVKIDVTMDAGAYVTLSPVVLSRGTIHGAGAYRWDHVLVESRAVATNTPPNGAFRGFGAPQTIWAIERHLDRVARVLGMDPVELKRKNVLRLHDTTATGQTLTESVGGESCLTAALAASEYTRKRAEGPMRKGRVASGIGASVFLHGAGFTGSGERRLKGRVAVDLFEANGQARLRVRTASTDIGQGTETVFRQIAAGAFGVAVGQVDFLPPSTRTAPDSGPTVASRTVMVVGSIVEKAARELRARVEESGGNPLDLVRREGTVTAEAVYEPRLDLAWDDETYLGDAYPVYGWGCDVAEVEVDLDTFETRVVGFWSAMDVGKAIHPLMCQGQIEGGTLQAIGWALNERVVYSGGLIQNARMTNYIVPTSQDAPPFETILVEEPFSGGPGGGAKGLGELPMDGGAPAVAAAVEHATGIAMDRLPLLPEDLFEAWLRARGTDFGGSPHPSGARGTDFGGSPHPSGARGTDFGGSPHPSGARGTGGAR